MPRNGTKKYLELKYVSWVSPTRHEGIDMAMNHKPKGMAGIQPSMGLRSRLELVSHIYN